MLNRSASLAMSTSHLEALPVNLDIKRHSPSSLYLLHMLNPYPANILFVKKMSAAYYIQTNFIMKANTVNPDQTLSDSIWYD